MLGGKKRVAGRFLGGQEREGGKTREKKEEWKKEKNHDIGYGCERRRFEKKKTLWSLFSFQPIPFP